MTTVPILLDRIFLDRDAHGTEPILSRTGSAGDQFGIGSPTVMTAAERTFERSLALEQGVLVCPRGGSVLLATCDGCPFFCRKETEPSSVICSYPIPARETFATRSRHSEAVRIALRHHLERT